MMDASVVPLTLQTALRWACRRRSAPADEIAGKLADFNQGQQGGSAKIRRITLLDNPPSANDHEISDKGTINRRAVLDNRTDVVEALFAEDPPASVRDV